MEASETTNQPGTKQGSAETWGKAALVLTKYLEERRKREKGERAWSGIKRTFLVAAVLTVIAGYAIAAMRILGGGTAQIPVGNSAAVVSVHGAIGKRALAESIVPRINAACAEPKVKKLVIDINSPGGSPSVAAQIADAVEHCQGPDGKHKQTFAVISGMGASAAYLIAMHADEVVADRYAVVGSVGAIIRYFDASELVQRLGIEEQVVRSGPLKGGPTMFSPTSEQDAELNQRLVKKVAALFAAEVAKERGDKLRATPEELLTGRTWTAGEAKRLGLIDRVAVLGDLLRTDLKGLKVIRYKEKQTLVQKLGMEEMVRRVTADILAPKIM